GGANAVAFPTSPTLSNSPLFVWVLGEALPLGFIGPAVEELFFRCVLCVCVFQILRPRNGALVAGWGATLASSGLFLGFHAVMGPLTAWNVTQLFVVGVTTAVMVLLTGRAWSALFAHVVYNGSFLALGVAGTFLQ
ncbi:CPBP family intramembrane glutamic endopeptidase, partial [Microbacterium sp. HMWF026]|uniref:CPBP family intramembrane glutamic endopeptidase n=1 Tax=Microbacterium sp. HMWF026 TaxID=2056861 RepID=UPI0015E81A22